jgi:hypothetical protein
VTEENVQRAEVELSCPDLAAALVAFGKLGFRVDMIMPADDPQVAVVSGHGLRLRLRGTRRPRVIRLVVAILGDRVRVLRHHTGGFAVAGTAGSLAESASTGLRATDDRCHPAAGIRGHPRRALGVARRARGMLYAT